MISYIVAWSPRWPTSAGLTSSSSSTTAAATRPPAARRAAGAATPASVVIHLSRNFGHQAAVSAGLDHARGRAVIVMDGDLQDPPEVIPQFVARWREGYDVVYAVRKRRKEGPVKRLGYFALLPAPERDQRPGHPARQRRLLPDGPPGRRRPEGPARTDAVRPGAAYVRRLPADRPAPTSGPRREAGRPKYTLRALIGLAIDGLVSFSSYPLRLVTYVGLGTALLAVGAHGLGPRRRVFQPHGAPGLGEHHRGRSCSWGRSR